jgi:hypothetical protein
VEAVTALMEEDPDHPSPTYMIGIRENLIVRVPLTEVTALVCARFPE